MNKLRAYIYNIIPKKYRNSLGKSKVLKPLRDVFFRTKSGFRELQVPVEKCYGKYEVSFQFVSSIQIATKAKKKGIETRLLNNSIRILQQSRPRLANDYIIADVGANFGYLSLVWSQTVCNQGKVYAFEPHPNLFAAIQKSIAVNKLENSITPTNVAVGKQKGSIAISLASTTSNTKEGEVGEAQLKSKATIQMITIDEYFMDFERLDFIKIDVDGIELDILQGAEEILARLKPIVVVETNGNTDLLEFFNQRNYTILNMELNTFDMQKELPLNIFCVPN
ncbi:FkbM family methyltransferase [Marinirhabdus gelatinilytica]|uniref:FkbM family methyltransferase n=1 Tax=Marinirhabdus gelatinilytica TaxID=1703343 RepID=A0A370Q8Z8_9FLAO|nr:FkbM family methyltransferase [Marinirhabdus gelatinilytica]RDK84823.1 FkbM family methyltransferase [Marinirhabdus gelatinilytica]